MEDSATSSDSPNESSCSLNETTVSENSHELSSLGVDPISMLRQLLLSDSDESSSTRNNSQAETAKSKSQAHSDSQCPSSNETSPTRKLPKFPKPLFTSSSSMIKTEACQPNEPLKTKSCNKMAPKRERKEREKTPLRAMGQKISILDEAKNEPKVKNRIDIDPLKGKALVSNHQPSVPDRTSANLPHSSHNASNSAKSRNHRKSAKETGVKTDDSAISRVSLYVPFSNETVSRNSQELRTQGDESNSLLMYKVLRDLNQSPRSNSPVELLENPLDEVLSEFYGFNSFWEAREYLKKTYRRTRTYSICIPDEAREPPAVQNEIRVDASETEASSHQQPIVQDCASVNDKPSSCDAPNSRVSGGTMCDEIAPRRDKLPIYPSVARTLLQSVLKEIVQYNEEKDRSKRYSLQFLNDISSTKEYGSDLEKDLMNHLAELSKGLPRKYGPNMVRLMTIESYILGAYKILTSIVVSTLSLILTVQLSRDFDGFILTYLSLSNLYDSFSRFFESNNIEVIEDEVSRNRLKSVKKMVQRLMLLTLTACRLFLVYIGENSEEENLRKYEEHLSDEDKKYLGINSCEKK